MRSVVTPVYKRDPHDQNYFGGYLLHSHIRSYGTRLKSRCTFCLCRQTAGRDRYARALGRRCRRGNARAKRLPAGEGFFFDDDTLTTTCRVSKRWRRSWASSESLVVQRQAMFPADDRSP